MPVEGQVLAASITPMAGFWLAIKAGIIVLAASYFIFSLIVWQQVILMSDTLITETSPTLRMLVLLHVGVALGVVVLLVKLLLM